MKDEGKAVSEIVIIRRGSSDDAAGAKGGAWKIAYADFVTAMMAFFLVMWLINASNEETRAQVASYFNPIKLTDTTTGARSLKDMRDSKTARKAEMKGEAEGSPPSKQDIRQEADLLANPPRSLDRIANTVSEVEFRNAGLESTIEVAPSLKPDKTDPGVGDPFDPRSWEKAEQMATTENPAGVLAEAPDASTAGKAKAAAGKAVEDAEAIRTEINAALGTLDGVLSRAVSIRQSDGGVLISLTETEGFEMFKTGSAEPEPQLMKLVQAVAKSLQARPGNIIIRGHTDSRPYRNKYYDNWQLSTARAHFARYILIHGGLEESRIRRVEGVADREPLNSNDPQAAENRRIDILVETPSQ